MAFNDAYQQWQAATLSLAGTSDGSYDPTLARVVECAVGEPCRDDGAPSAG